MTRGGIESGLNRVLPPTEGRPMKISTRNTSPVRRGKRWAALLCSGAALAACGSSTATSKTTTPAGTSPAGTTQPAAATQAPAAKGGTITVAIVDNPTMKDIEKLTPENFTTQSGIKVNYVNLDEQTLREQVTKSVGSGAGQYDVVMIGPYEAPQFGKNGWLQDLTPYTAKDTAYDVGDLLTPVKNALSNDGKQFGVPFYGESSFLMYRKDILEKAGVTLSATPTWDEVAAAARKVNTPDMAGICLRGKPGWGDLGASLTTVVNTFGGTWWDANPDGSIGKAQVNTGGFKDAFNFYAQLVKDAGEKDAANASFNECLKLMQDSKAAMWYDATVAAGILEAADSPIKGKLGYALAPTKVTKASGWLWSWALAMPAGAKDPDSAWKFMSWATSKEYIKLAGTKLPGGWAAIPPGSRTSTYAIPEYKAAAASFADITLQAMNAAPIDNPGTTKRPGLPGVQYVGVPEFQDVGTRCTAELSSALAGSQSVDAALNKCQDIASSASK
jgi:sorbitol/mannitol transport system substrate-binding protein